MNPELFQTIVDGFADRVADRVLARLGARGSADELLDKPRVEAEYPFKFRVITDAARRDELVLEHAGRKPVVRRSVLEAWIASRRTATTKTEATPLMTPREAARVAVAARAAGGAS